MKPSREKEVLYYRVDEFDNPIPGHRKKLVVHEYPVLKETEKGVWIGFCWEERRFVRKSGRKRFAWPSEEEAYESFKARKRKQIRILLAQIHAAEEFLFMAESRDVSDLSVHGESVRSEYVT